MSSPVWKFINVYKVSRPEKNENEWNSLSIVRQGYSGGLSSKLGIRRMRGVCGVVSLRTFRGVGLGVVKRYAKQAANLNGPAQRIASPRGRPCCPSPPPPLISLRPLSLSVSLNRNSLFHTNTHTVSLPLSFSLPFSLVASEVRAHLHLTQASSASKCRSHVSRKHVCQVHCTCTTLEHPIAVNR